MKTVRSWAGWLVKRMPVEVCGRRRRGYGRKGTAWISLCINRLCAGHTCMKAQIRDWKSQKHVCFNEISASFCLLVYLVEDGSSKKAHNSADHRQAAHTKLEIKSEGWQKLSLACSLLEHKLDTPSTEGLSQQRERAVTSSCMNGQRDGNAWIDDKMDWRIATWLIHCCRWHWRSTLAPANAFERSWTNL